jgi:dipeptidyl aminopeptidase/acylaminoacyl peptidase
MEPVPATSQVPIIDFVRPELFRDVQLNHTGTHVGAIVPDQNDYLNLVTYNLTTRELVGVAAPPGDTDLSAFLWLKDTRLVYLQTQRKFVGRYLYLTDANKMGNAELLRIEGANGVRQVLGSPPRDRSEILVNLRGPRLRYDHPEMINAYSHGTLVTRYPELKTDHGFNIRFLADKLGSLAFGVTQEDGILSLSMLTNDSWLKCPIDLDQVHLVEAGDAPGEIVVLGRRDGVSPRPLEFMNAETGKPGEVILQDQDYDFSGWLFRDPMSLNIVGAVYNRNAPHVVWFTDAYRDLQKAVDRLFPDQVVRIQGMDDAGKVLLITSGSDIQPAVYSWVNLEKHTSGLIKNSEPWIDPKRMRPMGILKYSTAEGRRIDAYLTLPASASRMSPVPMVVIANPLSSGRWTWGFNSQVQFLASRGYAVLQPNHRGSEGYTWMYPEEESWDFRKMSDDVARATKEAIATGLIVPGRVAIMGNSFGGYLAVSGATFEPGIYKCALSISGIMDWGDYIKQDKYRQYSDPIYSRLRYKLGDPSSNPGKLAAMSSLPNASQIHVPLFLAWGEYDNPELIGQSKNLASTVERNCVTVETMSFLDEAVAIRHLDRRIDLYQHIEAFLLKNL